MSPPTSPTNPPPDLARPLDVPLADLSKLTKALDYASPSLGPNAGQATATPNAQQHQQRRAIHLRIWPDHKSSPAGLSKFTYP